MNRTDRVSFFHRRRRRRELVINLSWAGFVTSMRRRRVSALSNGMVHRGFGSMVHSGCAMEACPVPEPTWEVVDCKWGEWDDWGACTETCTVFRAFCPARGVIVAEKYRPVGRLTRLRDVASE